MAHLPVGIVTYLFTDIESSVPRWECMPVAMQASLETHNAILQAAVQENGGVVFKFIGDELDCAFSQPLQALKAALAAQRGLGQQSWGETGPIRVRMGLHTGPAEAQGEDYLPCHTLNRIGRIHSAAYGGQILLSQETADLVQRELPEGVRLKDLGEHHLKGMQWLEHLYQVSAPGLVQDFPPLASVITHPHNLPTQLTSFVGREREIEAVLDLLRNHRLITLTGSGGVGKTRLALVVAARVLDDYPAGVWYIELAPLSDPDLVPHSVAYTLGLREAAGVSILDTLTFFLSTRQGLLLLDNCEHLLKACSSLADHLLVNCPKLRILASSREPLGVAGEMVFRVPSLTVPDPQQLVSLDALAACEGVRLFIDRAQYNLPGFHVTTDNKKAIAQVCQRLDGIPLAIELAAARLGVLPVAQVAARLDDSFRLLTGGSRSVLPRQQTLRATIDWSYRLLDKKENRLFRRLSVFAGGWTLEAAEHICSGQGVKGEEMLDLLSSLVDKSLVIAERKQGQETRFRLLETVRQYVREKLFDERESQALRIRHRDYFLHLAEIADLKYESEERLEWTRKIKLDLDNLRLAMEWSFHGCAEVEVGLRLAVAIKEWWQSLGYLQEACDWLLTGLEKCGSKPIPAWLRARSLIALGGSLWLIGDFAEARRRLGMGIAVCREIGDEANADLCEALYKLAMAYSDQTENIGLSQSLLDESVEVGRKLTTAESFYLAWALVFRAWMYIFAWNEPERAGQDAQESYNLACQAGCHWDCAGSLGILAWLAHEKGDNRQASQQFQEALALCEEAEDRYGLFQSHLLIGGFYRDLGDFRRSKYHYREALKFWNFVGSRTPMSISFLAYFGSLEIRQSEHSPAAKRIEHLRKAALLLGAAEKLRGGYYFFDRTFTLADYTLDLEFLRSQFADGRIARAWSEGQLMSLEQAWAYLF